MPPNETPQQQLDRFIDQFTPQIAVTARQALAKMRRRYPTAWELVYDNYNALAIGFSPSARTSDGIFSIALYPRWVSLFFLQARQQIPDPHGLFKGKGAVVRFIVLETAKVLDDPRVQQLMEHAVQCARVPFNPPFHPGDTRAMIIKSISAKQRPRTPAPL